MEFKCNATTYVFTKKLVFYRELTEQTVQQYNSFASVNVRYGTFLPVYPPFHSQKLPKTKMLKAK